MSFASVPSRVLLAALVLASAPSFAQDTTERTATTADPTTPPTATAEPTTTTTTTTSTTTTPLEHVVAVLDLRTTPGVEGAARALATLVTAEVSAHKGHRAIARGEVTSLISHQADAQLAGCNEPRCLADIGKLLAADRVVGGSLERIEGGGLVFSLMLVDPEGPTVLERVTYAWHAPADDIVDLARPAVDRLLLGKAADGLSGDLEVLALEGADVSVDDKPLGAAPVKTLRSLPIGVHHVSVRKFGFVPFDRDVAVRANETNVARVDLVDEASLQPFYARWYVWGSALAAVVVVGGTVAAVGTYQYLQTPAKLVVGGPAK